MRKPARRMSSTTAAGAISCTTLSMFLLTAVISRHAGLLFAMYSAERDDSTIQVSGGRSVWYASESRLKSYRLHSA